MSDKPVAYRYWNEHNKCFFFCDSPEPVDGSIYEPLYTTPQPKQEHGEPVASAWMYQGEMVNAFPWSPNDPRGCDNDKYWEGKGYTSEPLYTYPQPRKPLTNEQIDEIADTVANMPLVGIVHDFRTRFARAIEEAHDIKE